MARNILFITRYPKKLIYPQVTIYLNDKEIGVLNVVGDKLPPGIDRLEFLQSAREVIEKEYPMLTKEEIDVIRDFIAKP